MPASAVRCRPCTLPKKLAQASYLTEYRNVRLITKTEAARDVDGPPARMSEGRVEWPTYSTTTGSRGGSTSFQLLQLLAAALGGGAELLLAELGDQHLRYAIIASAPGARPPPCGAPPAGRHRRTQLVDVVWNSVGGGRHATDSTTPAGGCASLFDCCLRQPPSSGRQVRCGFSSRSLPAAPKAGAVSETTPSLACGHTNRPVPAFRVQRPNAAVQPQPLAPHRMRVCPGSHR